MSKVSKNGGSGEQPKPGIIKEGGYQPTTDPGPVPTSLVKPGQGTPPKSKAK